MDGKYIETIELPEAYVCRAVIDDENIYAGVCWSTDIPYDYDDNIRVSTIATPAGKWQVTIKVVSHPALSMPTRVFDEEMQADHYARAMVSKIKTKIDNQLVREYVQKILAENL